MKKRGDIGAMKSSKNNKTGRKFRTPMYGVLNSSSLPVVSKRVKTKALFVSRFSTEVSAHDVENSLKEQLKLSSIVCTKLKTKFNTYASFHISVTEDDIPLIHNTGVWPDRCLIAPFYGRLSPDQILNSDSHITPRSPSPGATSSLAAPTSGPVALTDEAHGGSATSYLTVKYCDGNVRDFSTSDTQSKTTFKILYQNVRGLRTKQTELFDNVCSMDFQIICLTETWLNDVFRSQTTVFPNSFTIFRSDRVSSTKSSGGCVLIAISFRVRTFKRKYDLQLYEECVWVEISTQNDHSLLIGNH
jgi:hypothetical protein